MGTEINLREDCYESSTPSLQCDEDEEKYFDRIPLVVSFASMRSNGFPEQGSLELKANILGSDRTMEIFTSIGMVTDQFRCRLEQGNPDSPRQANLVIKNKFDIWKYAAREYTNKMQKILPRLTTHESAIKYIPLAQQIL